MFCTNCGKQVPEGVAFCTSCGAPVNRDAAVRRPPAMQQPPYVNQMPNQVYAQAPIPQAVRKKSKAPIIIAVAVVAVAAIVVGAGFATNWFGLGGQLPFPGSQSSSSTSSDKSSDSSDNVSDSSDDASDSSSRDSVQSSSASSGLPDSAAVTKKLVVGFDATYPPFGFTDSKGKYAGIDLDLAREVCSRNGWSFDAVPVDWDAKDAKLENGEINCIWSALSIESRDDRYTFSEPYMRYEFNGGSEDAETDTIAVGFKLGDTETARIVSDTLREMYKDGTVEKILEKYNSESDLTIDNWILK